MTIDHLIHFAILPFCQPSNQSKPLQKASAAVWQPNSIKKPHPLRSLLQVGDGHHKFVRGISVVLDPSENVLASKEVMRFEQIRHGEIQVNLYETEPYIVQLLQ